ncbi:conserved domain protein [Verrucomicrobiia bacterium DG1235]|nr:conserved domain protein [Verrucomicrobiae bacterium DG1235]
MGKRFVRICLTVALCGLLETVSMGDEVVLPSQDSFHLILLAGQSNMAGRGDMEGPRVESNPQVLALDKEGRWVVAKDPLHWDKSVAGVGLGLSFAREYLKDHPGVTIGLIPAACGGSPISSWEAGAYFDQTDSHPYDDALKRVSRATQDGTLKGVLWHQGESDSHEGLSDLYEAKLEGLIKRFRVEWDREDLPVILGQLGQFEVKWGKHIEEVNRATKRVAKRLEHVGFVSSKNLESKGDALHFSSAALQEFGKRYYGRFKRASR